MAAGASAASDRPWDLGGSIVDATIAGEVWPYIDTRAEGPVLVMLPGSVGTCEMFYKQIAALGERVRIISVSYPAVADPARLADGLAGLLDHLGLPRASVLGSSFGGIGRSFLRFVIPAGSTISFSETSSSPRTSCSQTRYSNRASSHRRAPRICRQPGGSASNRRRTAN